MVTVGLLKKPWRTTGAHYSTRTCRDKKMAGKGFLNSPTVPVYLGNERKETHKWAGNPFCEAV